MRMYHTTAKDLDPARSLTETATFSTTLKAAYIYLRTGLCEWEMMRTEFCLRVFSKQLFCKLFQSSFQVSKGNILVDNKTFDLMEGRRMSRIHFIRTEYTSRRDHTDRQLAFFHDSCLYRRCLSTKHNVLVNIESILLILCRMICRNIQFLEIIKIILYFWSFDHFVAHTNEDTLYFFQCDGVRMTMTYVILLSRKGYVDNF